VGVKEVARLRISKTLVYEDFKKACTGMQRGSADEAVIEGTCLEM
jgi:hypothetical protein